MSTLWPRLRAAWMTLTGTGAAASLAFGLLVFVSVLASLAIPRESTSLRTGALRQMVAAAPVNDKFVLGAIGLTQTFSQQLAPDIAGLGARLRKQLAADGLPIASDPPGWSALTSGYAPVTGAAPGAGRAQPQFEVTYRSALAHYSHLVAGRLPSSGTGQVDGVVTPATAARFGLRPGARLTMGPVQLVITGIIRPVDPGSAFWTEDPAAIQPELIQRSTSQPAHWAGAVFTGAGGLATVETSLNTSEMLLTWEIPAALGRLTANQASAVSRGVGSLVSSGFVISGGSRIPAGDQTCPTVCPNTSPPVTMTVNSEIPAVLSPFITADNAVAPVLALLYVSLAVLGAVVVLLGARLVAQRRAAEFTLMRARGASLRQLAWLVLRPSAVIAVVAGAAAAALAISLTPGQGNRLGWWLAGVTIVVTLVGPVLISVLPQRVAAPATGRPVRRASGRTRAARRIVLEVALVAASIGGLIVLRNQGVSAGNMALFPSAAPVLVAIPVAVIVLRCYPPAARALARIAGRSRGVAAFVGLARATRTPPGAGSAGVRPGASAHHGGVRRHDRDVGHPGPGGRILAAGRRRRGHRSSQRPDVPARAAAPDRRDAGGFRHRYRGGVRRDADGQRGRADGGVRQPGTVRGGDRPGTGRPVPAGCAVRNRARQRAAWRRASGRHRRDRRARRRAARPRSAWAARP